MGDNGWYHLHGDDGVDGCEELVLLNRQRHLDGGGDGDGCLCQLQSRPNMNVTH